MQDNPSISYPLHLDAEGVAAALPHRGDILVTEHVWIHAHNHYTGWARWRPDLAILQGHFPGMQLVPGVLLIEATAQVAGVGMLKGDALARDMARHGFVGLLAGVRKCSFKRPVLPGETVRIEVRTRQMTETAAAVQAELTVGDEKAADIEILMVNTPRQALMDELQKLPAAAVQPC